MKLGACLTTSRCLIKGPAFADSGIIVGILPMTCLDVSYNIEYCSIRGSGSGCHRILGQDLHDSLRAVAAESISGLTKGLKTMTGVSA